MHRRSSLADGGLGGSPVFPCLQSNSCKSSQGEKRCRMVSLRRRASDAEKQEGQIESKAADAGRRLSPEFSRAEPFSASCCMLSGYLQSLLNHERQAAIMVAVSDRLGCGCRWIWAP